MRRLRVASVALGCWLATSVWASADEILFSASGTGADGVTLSAEAVFSISGNTLTITLTNTGDSSGSGQDVPGNTLTGLFFDLPDGITLTPETATTTKPIVQSSLCDVGDCSGTNVDVGGEFGYNTGTFGSHLGNIGIASAGYIDQNSGSFTGANLDDPEAPDGINFGIIASTTDYAFNPNGGLAMEPLIDKKVIFTLTIEGGTLTADQITNVSFQYGTGFNEPFFGGGGGQGIPEPAGLLLLTTGLVATLHRYRKRKTHPPRQ